MSTKNQGSPSPADSLSRKLEQYFLDRIVPRVAETAQQEALAAANQYLAQLDRAAAQMAVETANRIEAIDRHLSVLAANEQLLIGLPARLEAHTEEMVRTAETRIAGDRMKFESEYRDRVSDLDRQRDEIMASIKELPEVLLALKSPPQAAVSDDALALIQSEIRALHAATPTTPAATPSSSAAAAPSAGVTAVAGTQASAGQGNDEYLGVPSGGDAVGIGVSSESAGVAKGKEPPADANRLLGKAQSTLQWLWPASPYSRGLLIAVTAASLVAAGWGLGVALDARESRPGPVKAAPATSVDDNPGLAAWRALAILRAPELPSCAGRRCASFDDAWPEVESRPAIFSRLQIFAVVLQERARRGNCSIEVRKPPLGNLSELVGIANRIAQCRGSGPRLGENADWAAVEQHIRFLLIELGSDSTSRG